MFRAILVVMSVIAVILLARITWSRNDINDDEAALL